MVQVSNSCMQRLKLSRGLRIFACGPSNGVERWSVHRIWRFLSLADLQKMIFRFTSRHISELKAIANSEVAGSDVDLKISSFQAVLAHMWRSIIRKSGLNPEEVTHCNMRQRLNPPIGLATATTTAGEMLNNGLG
ncbi:hypothetical protein YC2023_025450 [Brassica napus]